jgi:MFS family permease
MPAAPGAVGGPSYRRVLHQRPFFLLWLSQLVSQSGDFVFAVALLWLVLEVTGSVLAVTIVFAATIVPGVVVGPFLGVYVDRWDRRKILIATNVAEGLLVAALSSLVLAHAVDLPLVVGIVLALGAGGSVVRSATNALVPQMVAPADLAPANALATLSSSFNQIVGFSLGGLLVALVGPVVPIEYDSLTFFAAAFIVAGVGTGYGRPPKPEGAGAGFGAELLEGLRFLRSQRALVELLVLGVIVNFFGNGVFALFAPYARFTLGAGVAGYGFLVAAVAAGGLAGAIAVGTADTRRSAGRYVLLGGCGIGLGVAALGLARSLPVALGLAVVVGVVLSITNVPLSSLFQAKVPARLLGRVGAAAGALIMAAGPVGALAAGPWASALSIPTYYRLAGLVILAVMAVGLVVMRHLRDVTYGAEAPA